MDFSVDSQLESLVALDRPRLFRLIPLGLLDYQMFAFYDTDVIEPEQLERFTASLSRHDWRDTIETTCFTQCGGLFESFPSRL